MIIVTPPTSLQKEHCASDSPGTIPPPSTHLSPSSDLILHASEPLLHRGTNDPSLANVFFLLQNLLGFVGFSLTGAHIDVSIREGKQVGLSIFVFEIRLVEKEPGRGQ